MSNSQIQDQCPQYHQSSFHCLLSNAIKTCITNRRGYKSQENYRRNPDLSKRQNSRLQNPNSIKRPCISKDTSPSKGLTWMGRCLLAEWKGEEGQGQGEKK